MERTEVQHYTNGYSYEVPTPRRPDECPVEDWLSFLGHRWNPGILWHLSASARSFGELMEALPGVTPKVLTERLKGLDQRGLVQRSPQSTFPRSVVYTLTQRGREVVEIIRPLEPWSKTARPMPD
jgi:DNA-binding HxlR family transcriptional regulator